MRRWSAVESFGINGGDCACLYDTHGAQRKAIGEDAREPSRVAHQARPGAVSQL